MWPPRLSGCLPKRSNCNHEWTLMNTNKDKPKESDANYTNEREFKLLIRDHSRNSRHLRSFLCFPFVFIRVHSWLASLSTNRISKVYSCVSLCCVVFKPTVVPWSRVFRGFHSLLVLALMRGPVVPWSCGP